MLLQVTNDCSLLPLLVQVVEVVGGLIAILMQQDPSRQGICGSLLLAMLQESCRRMAQLIQGMLITVALAQKECLCPCLLSERDGRSQLCAICCSLQQPPCKLQMVLFFQDVLLASASWYAVDITFL